MLISVCQLGGKDPAYVRPDADLDYTVAELVDGTLPLLSRERCSRSARRVLQLWPELLLH